MKQLIKKTLYLAMPLALLTNNQADAQKQPNILLSLADDWGAHAGAYGDKVVKTPVFDKLAKEGVLFQHAYISAPSCAPSRAAILTGQYHWRLQEGANLYGIIHEEDVIYTKMLEEAGYFVGYTRKGYGPMQKGWGQEIRPENSLKILKPFSPNGQKTSPSVFGSDRQILTADIS
jgi:hypothetical protein